MPQSSELSIDNGNNSSNNINNNNQLYAYGSMSTNIESGQNKIDDEEMNSLLDNSKLNEKNITWKSIFYEDIPVIANVSSAIMGVSIFAMPWGFLQSGVLGGTIITIFVAYLSFETARILLFSQKVLFQRTGEVRSYAEIASETLGSPSWGGVVKIATVISCLGSCVGYLIFLGEICGQLFDISLNFALFIAIFPLTILAWIRSFRELTVFTTIGVVAIIATVVYVVYDGQLNHDETDENDTFTPLFIPKTALNFVGPATFLFTSHYCVLAMGAEALEERQWQREHSRDRDLDMQVDDDENEFNRSSTVIENLNRPVAIAYALSAILIIIHGSTGYILFRNVNLVTDSNGLVEPGCEGRVCQNIILNLSKTTVRDCIGLSLCVAIVVSYVLLLAPAREHVEGLVMRHFTPCSNNWPTLVRNTVRMLLVILTAVVAGFTPYFGTLLGQVGGLTDALQAFVLPPLIYLSVHSDSLSGLQRFSYRLILVWGVCTISYTVVNLLNMLL